MSNINLFANNIKNEKLFKLFVTIPFFATIIFFVFNNELFTFEEILIYTIFCVILFKAISNIMLSLIVLFEEKKDNNKFEKYENFIKLNEDINGKLNNKK